MCYVLTNFSIYQGKGLRDTPSVVSSKEAQSFVDSLKWTFAKTMPQNPHEYIVKGEINPHRYECLFNYIKENHYIEWFWGKPYKTTNIGDYKYWIMTDNIEESRIINRKRI